MEWNLLSIKRANLSVIIALLDATSPSRGALGRPLRFRGLALRSCWPCWRKVLSLRQEYILERQRSLRKMNLMPRAPLLGELPSVSDG